MSLNSYSTRKGLNQIHLNILNTIHPKNHRLSSASPACIAQHSPYHIQPECSETAGLCSRMAESLLGDGQCVCAPAHLVVDIEVDVRLLVCLENCQRV